MMVTRLETRIPPVVIAGLAGLLIWAIAGLELDSAPLASRFGDVLGAVLGGVGVSVALAGLREFRRATTTVNPHDIEAASSLVTTGVYRITRNPMYLGLLMVLAGWSSVRGSIVGFGVGGLLFWAVLTRLQIIPEERILADKFGDVYGAYCRKVRRWI